MKHRSRGSSRSRARRNCIWLEENLGAVNVELTPEDLREIDEAASEIDVQGARYPEKLEALTGR
jgi:diketogulonate reductase-like aldo/keto reductase